ncbi:MAG: L-serine ammonia-lyase [Spirochaetaceae bacterium]|jgi:L-serine dehydratase|nr:L-serine ammonia-lyase [Spirochaetaceae bacterium]
MRGKVISMSIFDLLKAGPGPSSSHTIAPMRAGEDFSGRIRGLTAEERGKARGIRVTLYGSLSATGSGHGTDRALIAGLMGNSPASCPPSLLNELAGMDKDKIFCEIDGRKIAIGLNNIVWGPISGDNQFANTLVIDLLSVEFGQNGAWAYQADDPYKDSVLFSMEYYSVGGGFLQWKGYTEPKRGQAVYPYRNMNEAVKLIQEKDLDLAEMMLANEEAITGESRENILKELYRLIDIMTDEVKRGLKADGKLPGTLCMDRKAKRMSERAASYSGFEKIVCLIDAYAYAASEENAAGNLIVTTPTCGSAGVLPAILLYVREHLRLNKDAEISGLLAAVLVGFIAKQNASIAGAEVGCQGEVGVATAMGAAMITAAKGFSIKVVEDAAEIALEHQLGLTCDPVGGYVQIPCIERNAVAAVRACNAALIAETENAASHYVSFDSVLEAMLETGREMNSKYKETSTGGLAVCVTVC